MDVNPVPPDRRVIAEIGNCHEGNSEAAFRLVDEARKAGAGFVKFQAGTAQGFARNSDEVQKYKKYELGIETYIALADYAGSKGLTPFFSIWGEGFDALFRWPYVWRKIPARQCDKETIIRYDSSTTFISIPHWFTEQQVKALGITYGIPMHCVTEYPAKDPMLGRIQKLTRWVGNRAGFSDHTVGIEAAVTAVKVAGAVAIEKHFTLAHDFGPLRDHQLAATPDEMKQLVEAIQ